MAMRFLSEPPTKRGRLSCVRGGQSPGEAAERPKGERRTGGQQRSPRMVSVKPSESLTRPLRFGIVCSHTGLAKWQAAAVRHLIESGDAEPALLITKPT